MKPEFDDILYYFGDDKIEIGYTEFVSDEGEECNYHWTYTVDISSSGGLSDAIEFNLNAKTISIEASSGED